MYGLYGLKMEAHFYSGNYHTNEARRSRMVNVQNYCPTAVGIGDPDDGDDESSRSMEDTEDVYLAPKWNHRNISNQIPQRKKKKIEPLLVWMVTRYWA